MKRWLPYAPLLALGPVTGPLLGLAWYYAGRHQYARATLALLGIVAFYLLTPLALTVLITWEIHK